MQTNIAVERFLTSRQAHCSPRTVEWYGYMLNQFTSWCNDREISDLDSDDIYRFVAFIRNRERADMQNGKLKNVTVAGMVRAIRALFRWCKRQGWLENNPSEELKQPHVDNTPKSLTNEQVEQIKQVLKTGGWLTAQRDRALVLFMLGTGCRAGELTVEHVIKFGKALADQSAQPATICNYLTAINTFYQYLFLNRWLTLDSFERERLDKVLKDMRPKFSPIPCLPDPDAVTAFIAAAHQEELTLKKVTRKELERAQLRRLRNIALVHALRSSRMRVGELVALKREALIYDAHAARVTGKGNKQRLVYFDAIAWKAIQTYLTARKDGTTTQALATLPIFARHGAGSRLQMLTEQWVERIFAEISKRAELDIPITPHKLRHAFATRILDKTGNLAVVQELLGHASPATTRIYAKVSQRALQEAHRIAFENGDTQDKR